MSEKKDIDLDFALKYFVNYKEKPDYVDFEHTYSQPCYKRYFNGYNNPAKYLFTVPTANITTDSKVSDEYVDIETLDHDPPLFFSSEKLNEQLDKTEPTEYDDNWMDKIDRKEWNIIKIRLFKSAVQILETDLLARLAYKGQRDEAVKRHLMVKKTALRLKFLFGSVAWDPPTCQWLHSLLLERLPNCLAKVYTDAFQCLETKVPSHLLEHMTVSTSYMSVRSRLSGIDSQNNAQKKHWDMFTSALRQHNPKKIFGDPLLVLIPISTGKPFEQNTRPFRFVSDLSLLSTLVVVSCSKNTISNVEIPSLIEQMISLTVKKIMELKNEHSDRSIVLIGLGAASLLACHIAMGFKQKIAAVVCIGFNAFTMEGKISRANDKLMNLKTPVLFIVGQNATTATVDEVEEFRLRLHCKSGLVVVGGADDHLRVTHFLKMKCAVTQSIVDRCIINEISEFLNDIMQPTKVLVSILSNNDAISAKPPPRVSTIDTQFLKKIINESMNNPNSPIIKEITSTLAQLQSEQKYENTNKGESTTLNRNTESIQNTSQPPTKNNKDDSKIRAISTGDLVTLKRVLTSKDPSMYNRPSTLYNRSDNHSHLSAAAQYQLTKAKLASKRVSEAINFRNQSSTLPINFNRKTRGGRRPYVRRTIPPKRPNVGNKMVVISSYSSVNSQTEIKCDDKEVKPVVGAVIENITPDSLLDMPVVFADENDEENVINDVSLTAYQLN